MEVKNQVWSQDLRLPCFTESASILAQLNEYKRSSIPFQSNHVSSLKRNVWYALKRPVDRSRSGLLCIWPAKKCCIFVLGPRVALIRLRVEPQFLEDDVGFTVFAATLSPSSKKLYLEDTVAWKGRQLFGETFTQRLRMAKQWLEHCCIAEPRLMSGVELEMAQWGSLSAVRPTGAWDFISESSRHPLLWIAPPSAVLVSSEPAFTPVKSSKKELKPEQKSEPEPEKEPPTEKKVAKVATTFIAEATRESGPDQWSLKSATKPLGKALIRNLAISSALRAVGKKAFLEVAWNKDFNKWEALSIVEGPATDFETPT